MEHFVTILPKHTTVAKQISYYYFHDLDESDDHLAFDFFPHFKHGFTAYYEADTDSLKTLFTMNYNRQIPVSMSGKTAKLGVAFQPLGINRFITRPLSELYDPSAFAFDHWNDTIGEKLKAVFQVSDPHAKRDLLDDLFSELYIKTKFAYLEEAIRLIFDTSGTIRVEDLATEIGVSRKTLQRQFQQHLCCSPAMYKKVVKFRGSIYTAKQLGLKNLTEVSLYSMYYDQADFSNRFKELTGLAPREFFSAVKKMGEDVDIYWRMNRHVPIFQS